MSDGDESGSIFVAKRKVKKKVFQSVETDFLKLQGGFGPRPLQ